MMWLSTVASTSFLIHTFIALSTLWQYADSSIAAARPTHVITHDRTKEKSALAPVDILSWKERFLSRYQNCTEWLLHNNSAITDNARNEMETLLKRENITEYKKAALAHAELDPNASIMVDKMKECFHKLDVIGDKLERLNRARHKSVLHTPTHSIAQKKTHHRRQHDIQKVLSHWQLRKLHSYLTKTGDSESIIKALRHHFRRLPTTMQAHLIDDFFQYSPSLRRSSIHQRHTRHVKIDTNTHFFKQFDKHSRSKALFKFAVEQKKNSENIYEHTSHVIVQPKEQAKRDLRKECAEFALRLFGKGHIMVMNQLNKATPTVNNVDRYSFTEIVSGMDESSKHRFYRIAPFCRHVFGFHDVRFGRVKRFNDLNEEYLNWLTTNQSQEIEKMKSRNKTEGQIVTKLGDFYSLLNSSTQRNVSTKMQPYCNKRIRDLVGDVSFNELRIIYEDSGSIEQLTNKYMQLIGIFESEQQRNNAETVGLFCLKIYRIFKYDATYLTSWLTTDQRRELQQMIEDTKIGNGAVYDRFVEFYKKSDGEKRKDAKEVIETACKWFIAHMLGEDIADKIEEQRVSGNFSAQLMSAQLLKNVAEIVNEQRRAKTQRTLSICKRIYLGYMGDCFCNGHSSECDPMSHSCIDCAHNTKGIQCESCAPGYVGSGLADAEGCNEKPRNISTICNCHGHSSSCNENGNCMDCAHNTTGLRCESCKSGFYGDATQGKLDDCIKCPCGDGGECFVNEASLLECRICKTDAATADCSKKR